MYVEFYDNLIMKASYLGRGGGGGGAKVPDDCCSLYRSINIDMSLSYSLPLPASVGVTSYLQSYCISGLISA